jgi:hypothetical protein
MTTHPFIASGENRINGPVYSIGQFKLSPLDEYLQLDCYVEKQLQRTDLVRFLQTSRPIFDYLPGKKVLILPCVDWNVDIDSWSLLTKLKFENTSFKIAFVAVSIHQKLLVSRLAQLNKNIQAFPDKQKAVEWLNN